jgi:hypothetical protein
MKWFEKSCAVNHDEEIRKYEKLNDRELRRGSTFKRTL